MTCTDNCPVKKTLQNSDKWKYTLLTTIIFIIVASPKTYKVVNKLLGGIIGKIANADGCPTTLGLLVHAVVFTLILRYVMDVKI